MGQPIASAEANYPLYSNTLPPKGPSMRAVKRRLASATRDFPQRCHWDWEEASLSNVSGALKEVFQHLHDHVKPVLLSRVDEIFARFKKAHQDRLARFEKEMSWTTWDESVTREWVSKSRRERRLMLSFGFFCKTVGISRLRSRSATSTLLPPAFVEFAKQDRNSYGQKGWEKRIFGPIKHYNWPRTCVAKGRLINLDERLRCLVLCRMEKLLSERLEAYARTPEAQISAWEVAFKARDWDGSEGTIVRFYVTA